MNDLTKISLTIQLEGSTLVRKSEPEEIQYVITERNLNSSKKKKKGKDGLKVVKKGSTSHYSYTTKPAFQHINIPIEGYRYMVSNECPYFAKPKLWNKMTAAQRLEAHLQRICEHVGGKSFSYEILND